ncbi:perlucin-like protein [Mytilus galloprovincialis]|uniref:perlucin-like protein n=1 Tax=Mytilus galloprovincialis TaxID=29158 RepID=UPI003F7BCD6E
MVFIFVFFVVLLTSCNLSLAEEKRNGSSWWRTWWGGCPNGWKSFSDHCYLFVYKQITWMNAGIECHNRGGYLVQVDNSHEERWLTSQLKDEVWLGMNDIQNEGHWRWSDNSFVSYTNWRYSEPNGGRSENCGCYCKNSCYWSSFNWNDRPCSYLTTGYVCEKKK